jgi:hypothetical protein
LPLFGPLPDALALAAGLIFSEQAKAFFLQYTKTTSHSNNTFYHYCQGQILG